MFVMGISAMRKAHRTRKEQKSARSETSLSGSGASFITKLDSMAPSSYPFSAHSSESQHRWSADIVYELPAEPLHGSAELPDTPVATAFGQHSHQQESELSEIGSSELCWPVRPHSKRTSMPAEQASAQTVSTDAPVELPTSNPVIVPPRPSLGNTAPKEPYTYTPAELESSLRNDQKQESNSESGNTTSTSAPTSPPLRMRDSSIESKT